MSELKKTTVHEPLFHLSKRADIHPVKAWAIRLAAIVLGMLVCGAVAFILIEKLQNAPDKIDEFYQCFIKGAFGTKRKVWKFLTNMHRLSE